ncbi:MAG: hypothetical protein WD049_07545 [Candidatus Paceibacterota bacterium]
MNAKFSYRKLKDWPPLAWIASWRPGEDAITVQHGPLVETHPDWFGELVWDKDYRQGAFHQTDVVYGSGCRRTAGGMIFVTSAAIVDRLQWCQADGKYWVSNSLACLLWNVKATLPPNYPYYFRDFGSITHGIDEYRRVLRSSAGDVHLVYFRNLVWCNGELQERMKPRPLRDFGTFGKYREFLEASLCRLSQNMDDKSRRHRYSMLATISTGFDSPTVAVLARAAGLRQTLSFDTSRDHGDDNGASISALVGLEPQVVKRDAWREVPFSEVPFLASDAKGEDVYFAGAEPLLAGRVLLTGFDASRVWKAGSSRNDSMRRGDQSGLSLTEYRLWAGFIHCPVPTIASRQTEDLYRMIASPEMLPWRSQAAYNKPFSRRVLQDAGVPSHMFGVQKKAASVLFFDQSSFLSPAAAEDFRQWRRQVMDRSPAATRIGVLLSKGAVTLTSQLVRVAQRAAGPLSTIVSSQRLKKIAASKRLARYARYSAEFRYIFPWAVERAKQRYDVGGLQAGEGGQPAQPRRSA